MRKAIAIIGEGITEKDYIESLRGTTSFTAFPMELSKKASSLPKIENAIDQGFDQIFCLIDMDGKQGGKSEADYDVLKKKLHGKIWKQEKGNPKQSDFY